METPKIVWESESLPTHSGGYFSVAAMSDGKTVVLTQMQQTRITPEEARRIGTALIEASDECIRAGWQS